MGYNYILLDTRYPGEGIITDNIVVKFKPFYVGKGKGYRVIQHFSPSLKENTYKYNKICAIKRTTGKRPEYITFGHTNDEQAALQNEIKLIKCIKEKYGNILTNISNGGDNPPHYFGENSPSAKSVYQFTMSGKLIKKFNCIADAARELNILGNHISSCCKGKRNSCKNYRGSYTDSLSSNLNQKYVRLEAKRIIAFNGGEKLIFNDLKEAYRFLNCKNKGQIHKCILNPTKTFKKYYGKYE